MGLFDNKKKDAPAPAKEGSIFSVFKKDPDPVPEPFKPAPKPAETPRPAQTQPPPAPPNMTMRMRPLAPEPAPTYAAPAPAPEPRFAPPQEPSPEIAKKLADTDEKMRRLEEAFAAQARADAQRDSAFKSELTDLLQKRFSDLESRISENQKAGSSAIGELLAGGERQRKELASAKDAFSGDAAKLQEYEKRLSENIVNIREMVARAKASAEPVTASGEPLMRDTGLLGQLVQNMAERIRELEARTKELEKTRDEQERALRNQELRASNLADDVRTNSEKVSQAETRMAHFAYMEAKLNDLAEAFRDLPKVEGELLGALRRIESIEDNVRKSERAIKEEGEKTSSVSRELSELSASFKSFAAMYNFLRIRLEEFEKLVSPRGRSNERD